MENMPFRSVYKMDYLGGKFGRHLDSLLPSQSGVYSMPSKVGYETGIRLLEERNCRWLSHVFGPNYGDSMTLSPYSSDPMKSLRYVQRDHRRRLGQTKVVKPFLSDESNNARMEDFSRACDLHRDTYKDHGKQHLRYDYFQNHKKENWSPVKEYMKEMVQLIR